MTVLAPSRVTRTLVLVIACLAALGTFVQLARYAWGFVDCLGLIPAFDLGGERNIPTWVSTSILLANALAAGWLASESRRAKEPGAWHWVLLCLFTGWCSMDELAGIHESWTRPLRETLHLSGVLYYGWLVPAFAVIAVMLGAFWNFTRRLQPATHVLMALAAVLYFGGAVGMEMVSGYYHAHVGRANLVYGLLVVVEESLEMFGATALLEALLTELRARGAALRVEAR